jgi:DNA-directed RNA polymerase
MFLTAIECHAKQLTFASVHDSYWTHACDIDTMSDVIRDTFVRLHSEDILGRLRAEVSPCPRPAAALARRAR